MGGAWENEYNSHSHRTHYLCYLCYLCYLSFGSQIIAGMAAKPKIFMKHFSYYVYIRAKLQDNRGKIKAAEHDLTTSATCRTQIR